MILVIAEKPSVAQSIAKVLGATSRKDGYMEGRPYEWVNISKTGNIIQSINVEILGIARDAAFLWWMTGEKKYADSESAKG